MKTREEVLAGAVDRLRELTINELFEDDSNATGRLANSIRYIPISEQEGKTAIALEMEDYGFILDSGRGGARQQDSQSWRPQIVNWIRAKGIRPRPGVTVEQLSYAIYNSINRKGYRAKPFIEPALAAYDAQFANEYAEATANDIEINLKNIK